MFSGGPEGSGVQAEVWGRIMQGSWGRRSSRECSWQGNSMGAGPWSVRWEEAKGEVGRVQSSLEFVPPHQTGSQVFGKDRCGWSPNYALLEASVSEGSSGTRTLGLTSSIPSCLPFPGFPRPKDVVSVKFSPSFHLVTCHCQAAGLPIKEGLPNKTTKKRPKYHLLRAYWVLETTLYTLCNKPF